jgi:hypothetical protein
MAYNTTLPSLDIPHCQEMDQAVATILGTTLTYNKTLKRLCLSSCNFIGCNITIHPSNNLPYYLATLADMQQMSFPPPCP